MHLAISQEEYIIFVSSDIYSNFKGIHLRPIFVSLPFWTWRHFRFPSYFVNSDFKKFLTLIELFLSQSSSEDVFLMKLQQKFY